jgi:hypothetical protein
LLRAAELIRSFALWRRTLQTHNSNLQLDAGRWSHPRANPQGTSSSEKLNSRLRSLMHLLATLVIVVASTVVNRGITSVIVPNPGRSSPTHRIKVQGISQPLRLRSLWCKYAKASWTSPPWVIFLRELQCSWVHSLSTTLLLRFYLIRELPTVHKWESIRQIGSKRNANQIGL